MAILITGSTGYIGSLLTTKLASQGEDLRILVRKDPQIPEFNKPNIRTFKGDINDPESLQKALQGVDRVYHMAAYARLWAKDPNTFKLINVEGTRNVLAAAKEAGVEKVVYTSTAGVIGPSREKPMTENDPRITGFFNLYEQTKTEAEDVAQGFVKEGLNVTIVNPARVYGPGLDTGSNPVTKIVELYMKGKWYVVPAEGKDIGSYCHVDDVVDGHINAMERGGMGERYIFGGVNASFNELIAAIRKHSGVNKKLYNLPLPMMSAVSHVMKTWSTLTGTAPMITPDWVRRYVYHWELDSSKAVAEIGYRIRPLDDGIKNTVEWIRKNRM
ncbi:MAG TPA: SDR family oxidoreductase [Chitinophagaceae bacterium]|nr:SDR family oxidoreductase [Chitinophagaceae bacterium]